MSTIEPGLCGASAGRAAPPSSGQKHCRAGVEPDAQRHPRPPQPSRRDSSGSDRLRHPAATPDPAEQAPKPVIRGQASPTSLCLCWRCGCEPLTHRVNEQSAGVHSCCACCARLPAPRWRASRSPARCVVPGGSQLLYELEGGLS